MMDTGRWKKCVSFFKLNFFHFWKNYLSLLGWASPEFLPSMFTFSCMNKESYYLLKVRLDPSKFITTWKILEIKNLTPRTIYELLLRSAMLCRRRLDLEGKEYLFFFFPTLVLEFGLVLSIKIEGEEESNWRKWVEEQIFL